jgi:RNA polymerase sigma-70 factor (ECF subfamily)
VHEVARETGAPEGTVKARLSRGRAALQLILADGPYDQGASRA